MSLSQINQSGSGLDGSQKPRAVLFLQDLVEDDRDDRRISPVVADLPGPFTCHVSVHEDRCQVGWARKRAPDSPWKYSPRAFALGRLAVGPDVPSSSVHGQ